MWPVWVLLWKHCLTRMRKYFRTLFDYLSPILFFVLIHLISDPGNNSKHEQISNTEPFNLDSMPRTRILFTPETDLTNQLMDQVGAKLQLSRLDHLPRYKETGYFPFSNATSLSILEYSKDMRPTDAIVIFENMEGDTWPEKLDYTIRMKYNFMTYQYEPQDVNDMGPHELFGREYEPFMQLQWAIDTSYMHLMSGANVAQTLTLQEFPYGADHVNRNIAIVCGSAMTLLPISLQLFFIFLAGRLFEEKNSGIHELVKMAGVSWEELSLSHVLDVVPNLLLYAAGGAIFFKVTGLIPNTSGFFIFVALALHFLTVLAMAFATVYVFDITQYIELVTMAVYATFWMASLASQAVKNRVLSALCCVLPHVPFVKFWVVLGNREMLDDSITFSNMWTKDFTTKGTLTVGAGYLIMLLQILFFAMLAWYLSRVRPGKFGQALPWNFPFSKEYWSMTPKVEVAPEETQFTPEADQQQKYFEKAPAGVPVGIQINDVYKVFGKEPVLHGVNLSVYKGEITVLLGHNGAGKTTLISIITGQISATSGRVLVDGKDTFKQAKAVRKLIGLCPQQNTFFPNLTVQEHAMFFAMLKGQTYSQSKASAADLFSKLRLSDKAHAQIAELSGGMKRRAQLACAIAGGASVLMLDEPTSGLDVETRRELWNLLLQLRGDHTVLLTTHFMEEADALGDRIAALHHGVVRCHATTMFLKRAIGTGYRLSFTTIGAPKEAAITSTITKVVPDASVRDQGPSAISYNLPAKDTSRFPQLFAALEESRSELGIDTIGVGKSTLDEVFMELCSDVIPSLTEASDTAIIGPVHEKVTGAKLWARQFVVLLMRQLRYVISRPFAFLFITAFVVVLLWLFTAMANNAPFGHAVDTPPDNAAVALNLDLYGARPQRRAMVDVRAGTLAALRAGYGTVHLEEVTDVAHAILQKNIQDYNDVLVGIELNETNAKALYTTTVRHAAPVALNLLSNLLAAQMLRSADGRTITTRNHPLRGAFVPYAETSIKSPKHQQQIFLWACSVSMMVMFYLSSLVRLPCLERVAGTRHAHVMAGVPRALHWGATLVAHVCQAGLVCLLPIVIFACTVEADHTIDQSGFIAATCMLLLLAMVAFLGVVYLVSTLTEQSTASTILPIAAFVFTQITPLIPELSGMFAKLPYLPYIVVPPHTLTAGLVRAAQVAELNAYCRLNRDRCPALAGPADFQADKCCGSLESEPWSYWTVSSKAAGREMLILAAQAVVYFVLMYMADTGHLGKIYSRLSRVIRPPPRYDDAVVRAEAAYVEKAIKLPKKQITDAILCDKLQKNYPGFCRKKPFFAVKGISFSVKKGECFGLLGVNGAGKSSTFKMLTGETCPTGGDIFSNGHHLANRTSYMQTFGYCPQFFGLDEFLTGRQNLALVLTMRGLQGADVTTVADSWIEEVGLSRHANKPVSSYSGGCARRLAAAAALCQTARTALLDEPTAGVDPSARRRMHQALLRAKKTHSLIIASHSLDEIEALCHRIAIMSGGELCALGSASALKAQHAAGYSVVFKLSTAQDVTDGVNELDAFKSELHQQFDCTLQDHHQTMLNYHIKDTLRYSELFDAIERLKTQHPGLLDDYTVTETTLEEVFLAFAREAREPRPDA